ncbi:MAG TPA: S41 family peptidase [Planctomycetota bacterium]|nr:S41 family peptidase [Planctomycetota bacterium]
MISSAAALLLIALAGDPLLPNGDFKAWKDGTPVGWTVSVGATSPGEGESELAPGPEGGILLRGDAKTGRWRLVSREVALEPGAFYRLSFEARGAGLVREGRQFANDWIGVQFLDAAGAPFHHTLVTVEDRPWDREEMIFPAPASGKVAAALFLSHTGTLEARAFAIERLRPEDSFEVLVRHMWRYYSHFASKGIDSAAWAEKHRAKAAAAKDLAGWIAAVNEMLLELRDVHCFVRPPDGKVLPPFVESRKRNIDATRLPNIVRGLRVLGQVRGLGIAGTVGSGYGYIAVGTLPADESLFAPVLESLDGLLDAPGIVLDLRGNAGGDERRALELASRFAKAVVVYSRVRVRAGSKPTDLSSARPKTLAPRAGRRFVKPVVVLIGPGCVSSGEGLAQMMAAIDGVTLVGQPTAGASGNPQPVDLPNGVTVFFSRWAVELPDGTPLEGRGVPPDRVVEHAGEGDPTLEEAIRILDAARKGEKR